MTQELLTLALKHGLPSGLLVALAVAALRYLQKENTRLQGIILDLHRQLMAEKDAGKLSERQQAETSAMLVSKITDAIRLLKGRTGSPPPDSH